MRTADGLGGFLAGSLTWLPVVDSWLNGKYLGRVPVASGSVSWSKGRDVPGTLDLVVPRHTDGIDWRPGLDPEHPLACNGQTLWVSLVVSSGSSSWTLRMGTFQIQRTEPGAESVRVSADSMTRVLVDDLIVSPLGTRAGGTLASEARRVVSAGLQLSLSGLLTDRTAPVMTWGDSRLSALQEIVKAWPARLREDSYGTITVLPPLAAIPESLETLTDGTDPDVEGTAIVVDAFAESSRGGVFNRVVARSTTLTDGGNPSYQAVADQVYGAFGQASYGVVTTIFSSPLIESRDAAEATAATILADSLRPARTLPVTLTSDPRWELDDAVTVVADGERHLGYVSGLQFPLTYADGDMRMDVEVAS